jgi:hypothetical protein
MNFSAWPFIACVAIKESGLPFWGEDSLFINGARASFFLSLALCFYFCCALFRPPPHVYEVRPRKDRRGLDLIPLPKCRTIRHNSRWEDRRMLSLRTVQEVVASVCSIPTDFHRRGDVLVMRPSV